MKTLKSYWSQKACRHLMAVEYSILFFEQLCLTLSGLASSSCLLGSRIQFSSWGERGGKKAWKYLLWNSQGCYVHVFDTENVRRFSSQCLSACWWESTVVYYSDECSSAPSCGSQPFQPTFGPVLLYLLFYNLLMHHIAVTILHVGKKQRTVWRWGAGEAKDNFSSVLTDQRPFLVIWYYLIKGFHFCGWKGRKLLTLCEHIWVGHFVFVNSNYIFMFFKNSHLKCH